MKKKICHIITRFLNGGAEENTLLTCNYSAKKGDNVTLIIGSDFEKEIIKKLDKRVKLIKINSLVRQINPIKDFLAFISISKKLKIIKPDIVHTHESKAGIIGRLSAKILRIKLIIHTVHILPFINVNFFKKNIYVLLEKLIANITDKFICVSKGMMNESLMYNIAPKSKYIVIHSGFDIKKFRNSKKNLKLINFKNLKKTKIITMVGAFEKRKRQIEFLPIFKKLLKKDKNLLLILVGSGILLNYAKKKAQELKVKQNILFVGFSKFPEKYIALADLCVMNSIREGLPRVVPQYIAAGKPVITSNLPGIEEIIKNSKNGFIFNQDNQIELYKKLYLMLNNKKTLKKITRGAKKTDVSKWSHLLMPVKIDKLYDDLLKC